MFPPMCSHPSWRNIATNTDSHQLLSGHRCRRNCSAAAPLICSCSRISTAAGRPPCARFVWWETSHGISAWQKKKTCCWPWLPNVGSHRRNTTTFTAMISSVAQANRDVGLLSWRGITDEPYSAPRDRRGADRTVSWAVARVGRGGVVRRPLDQELVRRGLASDRVAAREVIATGRVRVAGRPALKDSTLVLPEEAVALAPDERRFVSRGGEKLAAALDRFGIDPSGRRCLDAGASTGGFTDCLLRAGAAHVVAVDVGYGQLDWALRDDARVTVLERT